MNRGVNPVNDPTSKYYVPVEQRRVLAEHEVTLNGPACQHRRCQQ